MLFYAKSTRGFYDNAINAVIPDDAVSIEPDYHATLLAGQAAGKRIEADASGHPILQDPPPPTAAEIQAALTDSVQSHLDARAKERGYDGILSLCTYATSLNAKFKAEGQAGVEWRDAVWAKCYAILADVNGGLRPIPTATELIPELPVFVWPEV